MARCLNNSAGFACERSILAMNPDLEGETTSLFIKKQLEAFRPLRVTRIARGVPSGGSLEYSDDMTLIRALQGRQSI